MIKLTDINGNDILIRHKEIQHVYVEPASKVTYIKMDTVDYTGWFVENTVEEVRLLICAASA